MRRWNAGHWIGAAALVWAVAGVVSAAPGCASCASASRAQAAGTAEGAEAEKPEVRRQTECPVMGGPIDRSLYVDHEGKRLFVCCAGCLDAVRSDPGRHARDMEAQGITLYRAQTHCPVMTRQRIRPGESRHVDHAGRRIHVCCGSCHRAVSRDPARFVESMEQSGIALDRAAE